MKKLTIITVLSSCLCAAQIASADTIAQWTFETSVPTTGGPFAPETGAGSATGVHASGATVFSNPAGNGSLESFSANTWATGDYFQFTVSTLGFEDLLVSWDQTRSSTGPGTFSFAWSINGTDFTVALTDYVVPGTSWSTGTPDASLLTSFSVDLSSVTAVDNESIVFFRLIDTAATGAAGGTCRVDNFTVTATAVPEPSMAALIGGFGVLALFMSARRRN